MKYYGKIGFGFANVETAPGVFDTEIVEKTYRGDVLRNSKRFEASEYRNDDLNVSNEFSIVADAFAYQNFQSIRYITYMGAKWKVNNVEVRHPRLILTVGGVYNG